jgi:ketosteroid isomerase-like protein
MSLAEKIAAAVDTYLSGLRDKNLEAVMGIYADDC